MKTREQWIEMVMKCAEDYKNCAIFAAANIYDAETNVQHMVAAKKKLRALLLEVPDPEGWKLVPIEPTRAMVDCGMQGLIQCTSSELESYSIKLVDGYEKDVRSVFKVMIAASPEYKGE
jgi:hypothetical protein